MEMQAYFRDLFAYNVWAHDRVWSCIMALTDEQFLADTGYAFGSVRNQAVHVMSVDRRWWARIADVAIPAHLTAEDYPTRDAARERWRTIEQESQRILQALAEPDFGRILAYDMPHRGGQKTNTVAQIIGHIVNHGTDHRAQILSMLHGLGAPTVEHDYMIYLWDAEA